MKKIIFRQSSERYSWQDMPSPAISLLPEWYKKMSPYCGESLQVKNRSSQYTAKKCIPFLDAMSAGYLVTLPTDIFVDQNAESGFLFNWKTEFETVSVHPEEQIKGIEIPEEYHRVVFKWTNSIIMAPPSGYSLIVSHPLNRADLPFYTLSGIVDADKYQFPINFPFLMKKNFKGILEQGTPIAQIIPFKREDWKSEIQEPLSDIEAYRRFEKIQSKIKNFYKINHWSRKIYK